MTDEPRVYEIDLTKKYILRFEYKLSQAVIARIGHQIKEWMASDQPFLLLDAGVKLVRVETEDE